MDPKQTIEQLEVEENIGTTKSSHTKNPTTCKDVRKSSDACGICGSFNVISQGVKYCESCGLEVELLGEYSKYWWSKNYEPPICKCKDIKNKYNYMTSQLIIINFVLIVVMVKKDIHMVVLGNIGMVVLNVVYVDIPLIILYHVVLVLNPIKLRVNKVLRKQKKKLRNI